MEPSINLEAEMLYLNEFMIAIPHIIPLFKEQFLGDASSDLFINANSFSMNPLISSTQIKNETYITVDQFFELLVMRWKKEQQFEASLRLLKDQIYQLFTEIGNLNKEDNIFQEQVIAQQYLIVDKIFDIIRPEIKSLAGNFCKSLLNGFVNEMKDNFNEIYYYLMYNNFFVLSIDGMFDEIKLYLKDVFGNPTSEQLSQDIKKITEYIQQRFQKLTVDCNKETNFAQYFSDVYSQKRFCAVKVKINDQNGFLVPILNEYMKKCIIWVTLEVSSSDFARLDQFCSCSSITIHQNTEKEIKVLCERLSNQIKKCNLSFVSLLESGISKFVSKLQQMRYLHTLQLKFQRSSSFTLQNFQALAGALSNMTMLNQLYLEFIEGAVSFNDESLINLSKGLERLPIKLFVLKAEKLNLLISDIGMMNLLQSLSQINILQINFKDATYNITGDSLSYLSSTITNLYLNFMRPYYGYLKSVEIADIFLISISSALIKMTQLTNFYLNASSYIKISAAGFDELTTALKRLTKIQSLELDFSNCLNLRITEFTILANSIGSMTSLQYFNLNLGGNSGHITDKSFEALATSLKNVPCLSKISINLSSGNCITNESLIALANVFKSMSSLKQVKLNFKSGKSFITHSGVNEIKSIRKNNPNIIVDIMYQYG